MHIKAIQLPGAETPLALILGTGDIASAIGRSLFLSGWGVIMLRDSGSPVLRRGMAFDDALDDGVANLDGIWAVRASSAEALAALALAREAVVLANLDLAVVAAAHNEPAHVLIDSRMRKYAAPADLRPLAACAIGIGPGFVAPQPLATSSSGADLSDVANVDVAIETLPGLEGGVVSHGPTATPTGRAVPLGGAREERFVYAPLGGSWQPAVALGAWIEAGTIVGTLGERTVLAPIDGCIRGMIRAAPGGVARGSKLVEIDPRQDAPWRGVPPRAQRIAAGVQAALAELVPMPATFATA